MPGPAGGLGRMAASDTVAARIRSTTADTSPATCGGRAPPVPVQDNSGRYHGTDVLACSWAVASPVDVGAEEDSPDQVRRPSQEARRRGSSAEGCCSPG